MPMTRLVDCGMDAADARALLARSADGEQWEEVAEALGERQHERSLAAERAGHRVTALEAARFAAAAFVFGQMARNLDDDVKRARYRRFVGELTRVAALATPAMERLEIPHRHGSLVGWLCLPEGGRADATVVVWGGLSGWGASYLPIADALTRRGLACLLAEGPGQGESRLVHGLYVGEDVAAGFGRSSTRSSTTRGWAARWVSRATASAGCSPRWWPPPISGSAPSSSTGHRRHRPCRSSAGRASRSSPPSAPTTSTSPAGRRAHWRSTAGGRPSPLPC